MNEALEAKAILTDGKVVYRKDILAKAIITNIDTEINTYPVKNYGLQSIVKSSTGRTIITLEVTNSYHDDLRILSSQLYGEILLVRGK